MRRGRKLGYLNCVMLDYQRAVAGPLQHRHDQTLLDQRSWYLTCVQIIRVGRGWGGNDDTIEASSNELKRMMIY